MLAWCFFKAVCQFHVQMPGIRFCFLPAAVRRLYSGEFISQTNLPDFSFAMMHITVISLSFIQITELLVSPAQIFPAFFSPAVISSEILIVTNVLLFLFN